MRLRELRRPEPRHDHVGRRKRHRPSIVGTRSDLARLDRRLALAGTGGAAVVYHNREQQWRPRRPLSDCDATGRGDPLVCGAEQRSVRAFV